MSSLISWVVSRIKGVPRSFDRAGFFATCRYMKIHVETQTLQPDILKERKAFYFAGFQEVDTDKDTRLL
jgi:hypothetical protein